MQIFNDFFWKIVFYTIFLVDNEDGYARIRRNLFGLNSDKPRAFAKKTRLGICPAGRERKFGGISVRKGGVRSYNVCILCQLARHCMPVGFVYWFRIISRDRLRSRQGALAPLTICLRRVPTCGADRPSRYLFWPLLHSRGSPRSANVVIPFLLAWSGDVRISFASLTSPIRALHFLMSDY